MNKTSINYTREDAKEILRLLDEFLAIKGETNSPEGKLLKKCMLDGFSREFGGVREDA